MGEELYAMGEDLCPMGEEIFTHRSLQYRDAAVFRCIERIIVDNDGSSFLWPFGHILKPWMSVIGYVRKRRHILNAGELKSRHSSDVWTLQYPFVEKSKATEKKNNLMRDWIEYFLYNFINCVRHNGCTKLFFNLPAASYEWKWSHIWWQGCHECGTFLGRRPPAARRRNTGINRCAPIITQAIWL